MGILEPGAQLVAGLVRILVVEIKEENSGHNVFTLLESDCDASIVVSASRSGSQTILSGLLMAKLAHRLEPKMQNVYTCCHSQTFIFTTTISSIMEVHTLDSRLYTCTLKGTRYLMGLESLHNHPLGTQCTPTL